MAEKTTINCTLNHVAIYPVTRPRSQLVSLDETPYYHCVGRCVRRAYLCGFEGDNCYEHRRNWIVERIKQLSSIFTINIAAYAIMSNHYHLVLHIEEECGQALSDNEVIERWLQLHKGPEIIHRYLNRTITDKATIDVVHGLIDTWRQRLYNLSWYMGELNEYIARRANAEDNCTGHFWESRFKSQALLDETALLSCMAYVDLNPIRAGMAETPERSDYTSIQERLGITPTNVAVAQRLDDTVDTHKDVTAPSLMPFSEAIKYDTPCNELPYSMIDYIELVDWTGRTIRDDKRGHIPVGVPQILKRLNIDPQQWLGTCTRIEDDYYLAIGPVATLEKFAMRLQQRWLKGINACRQLYSASALS